MLFISSQLSGDVCCGIIYRSCQVMSAVENAAYPHALSVGIMQQVFFFNAPPFFFEKGGGGHPLCHLGMPAAHWHGRCTHAAVMLHVCRLYAACMLHAVTSYNILVITWYVVTSCNILVVTWSFICRMHAASMHHAWCMQVTCILQPCMLRACVLQAC